MILISLVALTLAPQQGQTSFRVLDGLRVVPGVGVGALPALPVGGGIRGTPSCRTTLISVKSLSRQNATSASVGVVIVHP